MFKHFAQFSTSSETWATWATGATETPKPRKLAAFEPDLPVAQNDKAWATEATSQPANRFKPSPVAHVAQELPNQPGGLPSTKAKENCGSRSSVAQVAQVAHENEEGLHGSQHDEWDAVDWLAFFDERAAIGEYDGNLARADAEAQAFHCCISEWMGRHLPAPTGSERCAYCGQAFGAYDGLPYLTEGGHVWLHDACHAPWYEALRAEAARALMEMGIHVGRC